METAQAQRPPALRAYLASSLLFLSVAVVLAIPVLRAPPLVHDSFWIDYVWADRFHQELATGHLYPRWLSGSFGGLGAPTFYFYAPLAFYLTSLAIALGFGIYPALIASFIALHAASGLTMFRWLGGRGRGALGGALLYMVLPYHLLDFCRRGALAEFAAYALLPLVARQVERAGTRRGIAGLAFTYAALVLTHLPIALLASVLLLPALALRAPQRRHLVGTGCGLALGLLLASVYLLPALLLQRYANMGSMWASAGYHPAAWSLLTPDRWPSTAAGEIFAAVEIALAVAAVALWRRRQAFWPTLAFICCLLAANVVPGFWSLPLLAKVQYPWRALTIAEFAIATAFGHRLAGTERSRRSIYGVLPALVLSVPVVATPFPIGHPTLGELDRVRPEVPEYLPGGTPLTTSEQAEALARAIRRPVAFDGVIVSPRFWFPATTVRCGARTLPAFADRRTGLVAYRASTGCTPVVTAVMPTIARAGWLLSGLGLITAAALGLLPRRRRRPS